MARSVGILTLKVHLRDTDAAVATCSADHKIKIFRKSPDGTWELETEWKVSLIWSSSSS